MNTINFDVRYNLSRWACVADVSDTVLLNFELLVECDHCYTGRFQSMSELKSLQ